MDKMTRLRDYLKETGKIAVAFSGGVDSSFLLKAARDILGRENVLAITIESSFNPVQEINEAQEAAADWDVPFLKLDLDVFAIKGIEKNPTDRCYICKTGIFENVIKTAKERGFHIVVDGTNADDVGDYRPGMKALSELGVKSPLKECGFTKADIRQLSKEMNVYTWNKPSKACLASRIPYGETITEEKLRMVEKAEEYLCRIGFVQLRVRSHGNLARIEISPDEMQKVFDLALMEDISNEFKKIGFSYTALDLKGYRTGSLNEVLIDK